jgi:hypothetical protein
MGVGIPDAVIHQIAESTLAHVLDETPRQVAPQLVHGDLQNEPGCGLNGGAYWRQRFGSASNRRGESQRANERGGEEAVSTCSFPCCDPHCF